MVLPPRYADELKNNGRLSFTSLKAKGMHGTLPGFKAIGTLNQDNRIIQIVAQQDLTRSLPRLTPAMSSECAVGLEDVVGDGKEWHDVVVKSGVSLPLVARLSTLAFMGRESCYDREWIKIVVDFTVNIMLAAMTLYTYPRWMRPLVNYLIPECRALRAQERRARQIIDEKLAARRHLREKEADLCSSSEAQPSNALDWFQSQHQRLGGEYNPTLVQLMMAFGAIHTTADLLTQVILDLAVHRHLMGPLRREIAEALGGRPIDKTATQKMKLLDSVLKETQRMKPMQISEFLAVWCFWASSCGLGKHVVEITQPGRRRGRRGWLTRHYLCYRIHGARCPRGRHYFGQHPAEARLSDDDHVAITRPYLVREARRV